MSMTLLHAFAAVLTVLLFIVRQRCALPSISSGKRRSICQLCLPITKVNSAVKPASALQSHIVECSEDFFLTNPKYKRDPEIDVDNEEIGFYPMG